MRKFLCVVFIMIAFASAAFAMKNEPDGYGDVKWEDTAAAHGDKLKIVEGAGSVVSCIDPNEKLTFGSGQLKSVVYCFDEEGFASAELYFDLGENRANYDSVYRECVRKWGAPSSMRAGKSGAKEYTWSGARTFCLISEEGATGQLSIMRNLDGVL
ncbi:hypothetical protein LJC40_05570 [Synergistaceae bacterium OttesenSCG-928-D05]|nr:hypothetical protein [Synergistaceae bacterium OttesenSCG-928-D05]